MVTKKSGKICIDFMSAIKKLLDFSSTNWLLFEQNDWIKNSQKFWVRISYWKHNGRTALWTSLWKCFLSIMCQITVTVLILNWFHFVLMNFIALYIRSCVFFHVCKLRSESIDQKQCLEAAKRKIQLVLLKSISFTNKNGWQERKNQSKNDFLCGVLFCSQWSYRKLVELYTMFGFCSWSMHSWVSASVFLKKPLMVLQMRSVLSYGKTKIYICISSMTAFKKRI